MSLHDTLNPSHLHDVAAEPTPATAPEAPSPKAQREYAFFFKKVSRISGTVYEGSFISAIPSVKAKQSAGTLRGLLAKGVPHVSLDPATRELNYMLAELSFAFSKAPDWAKTLDQLQEVDDEEVLFALQEEVDQHRSTFFKPKSTPG